MKKKLLLFFMLLTGSVGTCLAQYSAKYDFSNTSMRNWEGFSFDDGAASFTVNLNGGYNDAYGDDEMTVVIPNFTFNATGTNPMIFAFNTIKVTNTWETVAASAWRLTYPGDDNLNLGTGIKNMSPRNNVFSVLNLRAGEIVKIKSLDNNPVLADQAKKPLKNRFIVECSPNAINNRPWSNPDAINNDLLTFTQEFIMTADGNLDLKVAPWLKIFSIEIVSNYTNFQQGRAHVGTDINVTLSNRIGTVEEDQTGKIDQWGWSHWNNSTNSSEKLTGSPNTTNGVNPTAVTNLRELWSASPHYVGQDGHLIWNVASVPNGVYHVEVFATSHNNVNSNNFTDGDETIAYVYAKGGTGAEVKKSIPVFNSGTLNASYEPFVREFDVTVDNGTLELGLGLAQGGKTNWHCIQIKSLTRIGESSLSESYAQAEPVILYRGDLEAGTVNTTKNSNGNWNINISGFSGKQYTDGYWEGGSIIVMLDQTMYTYTVPYKVNPDKNADFASWNLWQNPLKIGRSDQPIYQSLLKHDMNEGNFTFGWMNPNASSGKAEEPLFLYNKVMNGQNSYYHPETAGLIFEAAANGYGILNENLASSAQGENAAASPAVDEALRDDLYGMRYVGLRSGNSMIIPELEDGDEVWVYIDHFGEANSNNGTGSSLGMKVWNAKDALGKTITDGEPIVFGGSTWGPSFFNSNKEAKTYVGAMHFYARGEDLGINGMQKGDMKFEITGRTAWCYARIAYVRIVKHNPQNIISRTNELLWYDNSGCRGYEFLTTQDAAGTGYTTTTGSFGLHESGRGNMNQTFTVLEASGTLDKNALKNTYVEGVIGTYKAHNATNCMKYRYTSQGLANFGSFLLRGMDWDRSGKYCIDYADRVISVGYRQTMNYPYTWDFTDILNSATGNSQAEYDAAFARVRAEGVTQTESPANDTKVDTTAVWVNTDGVISLQNNRIKGQNNRTLCSGTQLFANNTFIEEAAGLGWATINMDYGFNNSIQIVKDGVKIQTYNGWETRLFVPAANKAGRLYIRGKKLNDGKAFVAKAFKGSDMGPNTMKAYASDPRVNLTPLLPEGQTQTIFHYEGNFGTYIEGQQAITETKHYDDYLEAIVGGESTQMEERLGSDRTVDNPEMLYEESGYDSRITSRPGIAYAEYNEDGTPVLSSAYEVTIIESDENIYLNDADTHDRNLALFDKNVTPCSEIDGTPITDHIYTNFIYTGGSGKSAGRYLKVTLPASDYGFKVTIVGRSQVSRQINVFAGTSWGNEADALATMIVRDHLSAKTLTAPAGTTSLVIGSDNSAVEIYAIYVEENKTISASDPEDWAGYVDVAASDGGVTLYLNDIIIEKIGYSTDVKTINDIGWASESRDHYIDHNLTEYFTNDPVKAYVATGTAKNGSSKYINAVSLTALEYPMHLSEGNGDPKATTKTGCVMYNTNNESVDGGVYLFVPAIWDYLSNDKITNANFIGDACTNGSPISTGAKSHANADEAKLNSMSGNMMVANLTGQTVPYSGTSADMTNYVLSYRFTDGEGKTHPAEGEAKTERFVRVGKGGATGSANTAYLQLPTADVKPEDYVGDGNLIIIFDGENQGTDPDGIEELYITTGNGTQGTTGSDSYYTLSGQKVNNPTKPGVYVKNGKKVFVK